MTGPGGYLTRFGVEIPSSACYVEWVPRESDHQSQLLAPEILLPLTTLREAERLGVRAMAHIKLYSPDAPFAAYLAGFDGADTVWGLICAGEIYLGHLYFSGLTVAWQVWGIPIQNDHGFKPVSLDHLCRDHSVDVVKPRPNNMVPSHGFSRERIRSRLCVHLAKEPHHLYCNR